MRYRKLKQPFCHYHCRTREKDGSESLTTCTAHLADGLVMECPYHSIAHAKAVEYPCVDAKPLSTEEAHKWATAS